MNGGNGIKQAKVTALAALVIGLGGNATVYLDGRASRKDARDARADRVKRETQFFKSQCHRDFVRDNVVVLALQDAQERAKASIGDPEKRRSAIRQIQSRIDTINSFRGDCQTSIPD